MIVEFLNQFCVILFGYEINSILYYKNLVYEDTLSETRWVIQSQLLLKYFGPNIQHIARADNVLANALIRIPTETDDQDETITTRYLCCANEPFAIKRNKANRVGFSLNILLVQIEQQLELSN